MWDTRKTAPFDAGVSTAGGNYVRLRVCSPPSPRAGGIRVDSAKTAPSDVGVATEMGTLMRLRVCLPPLPLEAIIRVDYAKTALLNAGETTTRGRLTRLAAWSIQGKSGVTAFEGDQGTDVESDIAYAAVLDRRRWPAARLGGFVGTWDRG